MPVKPSKRKKLHVYDPTAVLAPAMGTASSLPSPPTGFRPVGMRIALSGIDPKEIPQTIPELGELLSHSYDLTVKMASSVNIPVIGSVSGGIDRRVVVFEWTRYKELTDKEGVKYRYGFVIRFCLTVSRWDATGQLSLPFLTAQAEVGSIQASWMMQVRGLTGAKIDAVVLPPQDLKVETFVIAKQSLEAAIRAISDPTTKFVPGIVVSQVFPGAPEVDYWLSAVKAFALESVRRGRTAGAALARLGSEDPFAADTITEVYAHFNLSDPNATPGSQAKEKAAEILRGIRADV